MADRRSETAAPVANEKPGDEAPGPICSSSSWPNPSIAPRQYLGQEIQVFIAVKQQILPIA